MGKKQSNHRQAGKAQVMPILNQLLDNQATAHAESHSHRI